MSQSYRDDLKIGLNHHLLYCACAADPDAHERTLMRVLADPRLDVVDLWIHDVPGTREREIAACLASGKEIYYNVGSRAGKPSPQPCAVDPQRQRYSREFYMSELDRALQAGARKVITNSGADIPDDRASARSALIDFYLEICAYVGDGVLVMIEPTDRDMDKRKLIGPSLEASELCRAVQAQGCSNMATMVDMGHVPLMGETLEQAFADSADLLGHIHMGNCVLKDRDHPLFGDKHVPWDIGGGEYGVGDVAAMLRCGFACGWFGTGRGSASFEMRPYQDASPEHSLDRFFAVFERAWSEISAETA